MSSSTNNLATIAAEERALIFKPIEEKLLSLKNNKSLGLSFEKNTISNKNDAVTINTGALRISVRAFVSKNPNTGAVINSSPINVAIWKDQDFKLNEGCETPQEKAFNTRDFSSYEDALSYVFKEIDTNTN